MARLKVTRVVCCLVSFLISELVLIFSYNENKLLSGILYIHRITDNRVAGSSLKDLRVFQKLCGKDALDKVYFTTTMWDEVELSVGERRLAELKAKYWRRMITQGAQVACCRSDDESPKRLVRRIVTFLITNPSAHIDSTSQQIQIEYGGHLQERTDISRRGTPTLQQVENQQGPSSRPQKYDVAQGGGALPIANREEQLSYVQENPVRSDSVYGKTPVPQHPLVENSQGPSSQAQNMEKVPHIGQESAQTVPQGYDQVAEKPGMITKGQEAYDTLAG